MKYYLEGNTLFSPAKTFVHILILNIFSDLNIASTSKVAYMRNKSESVSHAGIFYRSAAV